MNTKKQPKKPTKPKKKLVLASEGNEAGWFGSMKGTIEVLGDIIAPANDEGDWEVLRD